jgi:predicted helicase
MAAIIPNERCDWINQGNSSFHKYPEIRKTIFNIFSNGIQTGKDHILYDFTEAGLLKKLKHLKVEDLSTCIRQDSCFIDHLCPCGFVITKILKDKF